MLNHKPSHKFVKSLRQTLIVALSCLPLLGQAGQTCSEKALSAEVFQRAMLTAQNLQERLNNVDSDIVLIGRAGQDLSKYKLRYSHMGFAYRQGPDAQTQTPARWRVVHLLNDCGSDKSDLWYEGLGNFFLDDMFDYDSVILVPPPAIAERLLTRLQTGNALRTLHTPKYSMVAYPFSTRYENSNAWVLETTAAAISQETLINTREEAQAWLKLKRYQPSEMKVGAMTRLGGRMFKANIAFDDHPDELRYNSRIQTVTVDSMLDFFKQQNWTIIEQKGAPAP